MKRCTWCNHIIWPWQKQSPGGTLHVDCWRYVEAIAADSNKQYELQENEHFLMWIRPSQETHEQQQWRLRAEEEDRL